MSTARKAGHAAGALFLRKCWTSIINIGVIAYLARTLPLEEIGVVGVCATILSLIQILAVSGISEYVIFFQGSEDARRDVTNSAFWLNLFAAVAVVIVSVILAPSIADQFDDHPSMGPALLVLLAGFFASTISSIPKALYRKEINYGPLVFMETIQETAVAIGKVFLAWQGFGVFSLVLPPAIISPIIAGMFLWKSPLRLKNSFDIHHWKAIFSYTRHIIGARILTRAANEGDNIIVAKVLGLQAAGVYALAYRMANILFLSLMPVVVDVSMPVFARISADRRRLFLRYATMLSLIMFVMFPVMLLLFVNANELAEIIYGKIKIGEYLSIEEFGMLVQVLMISVFGRCISSPTGGLFNATGKPHIGLCFVCVFTPLFLGTLYFTSGFGLMVAASTVAIFFTVGQAIQVWLASSKVFEMPLRKTVSRVLPYLIPSTVAAAIALVSRNFVRTENLFVHVILVSTIFSVCYGILFRLLASRELFRIVQTLQAIHPRLGSVAKKLSWPHSGALARLKKA
ncbi:MAG: O-antigen/teichoic acid export membrane protein [Verrucomicrobiales bacterium]|jgi:O-antigen/teichoic acid export membrane protein